MRKTFSLPVAATAAGGGTPPANGVDNIEHSVRFNSADSAYLNRTPSSAGNRKTWTWSAWVKKSSLGRGNLFNAYDGSNITPAGYINLQFSTADALVFGTGLTNYRVTTQVFRDLSAWYHLVIAVDTTQATANDRVKIYVNGEQITDFSTTNNPAQNADLAVNGAFNHRLGSEVNQFYLDGYLANIELIDGLALAPSYFGFTDTNNVWQPKAYSGSYGTNGAHLDFADTSSATALGNDVSGNNNDWTVNNISVTAGSGNDSLVDSPTNYGTDTGAGGEVRGNYCTLNPLFADTYGSAINGNLEYLNTGGADGAIASTMAVSSGKWYYETSPTNNAHGSGNPIYPCGFLDLDISTELSASMWYTAGSGFYGYYVRDGRKIVNGTISSFATSSTVNDIIGFALDLDAGELEVYKNGTSLGVVATGLTGRYMPCVISSSNGQTATVNFGQRPFSYTAPSGYKSLCSTNLPTPAVADGSTAMNVALWTGDDAASRAITGLNHSPDLVWIKRRDNSAWHAISDSVRGAGKILASNSSNSQYDNTGSNDAFKSFDSDGFTVGYTTSWNTNISGHTHVAWAWDAGSSTVSNTDGSITSQVRANPTAGVSIVTYSGNSTSGATVGHGLNATPSFIIVKSKTGGSYNWIVYSEPTGATKYLSLNQTIAATTISTTWNNTAPSSSVFTLGNDASVNVSGNTYVAYCFAPVEGFSAFGSYTGSTSNAFVYTGMRPRWLMIKRTDTTGNWQILDTEREGYNVDNDPLWANLTNQEGTTDIADILSNGFKMRDGATGTYIYAAFAEHPFKTSRAR